LIRTIPILILLSSIANFAKAQVYAFVTDTAVIGRSVWYGGDTTYRIKAKPQSGRWIVYYDTTRKQIAFDINYKSYDRYDLYSWYRNGQQKKIDLNIDSMPSYVKNTEEWNSDGQHIRSLKYTRDSCVYYNWFPNGQLVLEGRSGGAPWREDLWRGESYTYVNGVVARIDKDLGDSSIVLFVYPDKKISQYSVYYPDKLAANGGRERIRIRYYQNGQLWQSVLYPEKGRQPIIYFYESGAKKEEGDWEYGNIGKHREYYESGKLKAKGEYVISKQVFNNSYNSINYYSTKSGHWVYYNEEGKIIMEEWYSNPEWNVETVIKYKTFGKKGIVETEGEKKVKKLPTY
jgi:hypothetical protein